MFVVFQMEIRVGANLTFGFFNDVARSIADARGRSQLITRLPHEHFAKLTRPTEERLYLCTCDPENVSVTSNGTHFHVSPLVFS